MFRLSARILTLHVAQWEGILSLIKSGKAKPTVYEHVYEGLETLPRALQDLSDRKTYGKVVVRLHQDPEHPPKRQAKI